MAVPFLPISPLLPDIVASLAVHPRLVLEAPPGAGKTTQVPLALLGASWCHGKILMLEPRRIAARAAAGFMADSLGEAVGATVGYRIRFESKVSAQTRVEVVTEGILTRMLQDDPMLEGVSAILFDEFHERHLHSDLGLALCVDVQSGLREDLRLLVMSATLDGDKLARFLDCPRLTSEGRSFPVTTAHFPARPQEALAFQLKRCVQQAIAQHDGDVLCFLPGKYELDQCARVLADIDAQVLLLHGELSVDEQARVLRPGERRRVVLATNVAESSVTLPSVRVVIDSGLAREPRLDAGSGMSRLETVNIAQSSATQRAGRAGRVAEGWCYRLWPESQRLEPGTRPEIARSELAGFMLELRQWGADALRLLDAPPPAALAAAVSLLQALDALDDDGRITPHGKKLLAFGTHPRIANLLVRARRDEAALACDVAALLDGRDPLRGEARRSEDLRDRLNALHDFRAGRRVDVADRGTLALIDQTAKQWRRRLHLERDDVARLDSHHQLGDLLALAYPDRVAKVDASQPRRYQLSNGRGARLHDNSLLYGEPWLVVSELRFEDRDSLIQRAAPLDPSTLDRLYASHFHARRAIGFNRDKRAVEASEERCFAELVLERRTVPATRDAATAAMLCEGVRQLGLDVLPWSEGLREWQARVESLRAWCPELGLPDCCDTSLLATLDDWLLPYLDGKWRLSDFDGETFGEALRSRLDYAQRKQLDEYAPRELTVPSGMTRKLTYQGDAPVLAVKLQELFGLADTPRIAKGKIAVVLHLLSPALRPLQVTQDLRGFWERTYPEVKKELKGRYPKHPWPDDPWTATPTHRAKPRAT
jgi:ATP-dependent helicase HrpB